jgi:hypothetical protein
MVANIHDARNVSEEEQIDDGTNDDKMEGLDPAVDDALILLFFLLFGDDDDDEEEDGTAALLMLSDDMIEGLIFIVCFVGGLYLL